MDGVSAFAVLNRGLFQVGSLCGDGGQPGFYHVVVIRSGLYGSNKHERRQLVQALLAKEPTLREMVAAKRT